VGISDFSPSETRTASKYRSSNGVYLTFRLHLGTHKSWTLLRVFDGGAVLQAAESYALVVTESFSSSGRKVNLRTRMGTHSLNTSKNFCTFCRYASRALERPLLGLRAFGGSVAARIFCFYLFWNTERCPTFGTNCFYSTICFVRIEIAYLQGSIAPSIVGLKMHRNIAQILLRRIRESDGMHPGSPRLPFIDSRDKNQAHGFWGKSQHFSENSSQDENRKISAGYAPPECARHLLNKALGQILSWMRT